MQPTSINANTISNNSADSKSRACEETSLLHIGRWFYDRNVEEVTKLNPFSITSPDIRKSDEDQAIHTIESQLIKQTTTTLTQRDINEILQKYPKNQKCAEIKFLFYFKTQQYSKCLVELFKPSFKKNHQGQLLTFITQCGLLSPLNSACSLINASKTLRKLKVSTDDQHEVIDEKRSEINQKSIIAYSIHEPYITVFPDNEPVKTAMIRWAINSTLTHPMPLQTLQDLHYEAVNIYTNMKYFTATYVIVNALCDYNFNEINFIRHNLIAKTLNDPKTAQQLKNLLTKLMCLTPTDQPISDQMINFFAFIMRHTATALVFLGDFLNMIEKNRPEKFPPIVTKNHSSSNMMHLTTLDPLFFYATAAPDSTALHAKLAIAASTYKVEALENTSYFLKKYKSFEPQKGCRLELAIELARETTLETYNRLSSTPTTDPEISIALGDMLSNFPKSERPSTWFKDAIAHYLQAGKLSYSKGFAKAAELYLSKLKSPDKKLVTEYGIRAAELFQSASVFSHDENTPEGLSSHYAAMHGLCSQTAHQALTDLIKSDATTQTKTPSTTSAYDALDDFELDSSPKPLPADPIKPVNEIRRYQPPKPSIVDLFRDLDEIYRLIAGCDENLDYMDSAEIALKGLRQQHDPDRWVKALIAQNRAWIRVKKIRLLQSFPSDKSPTFANSTYLPNKTDSLFKSAKTLIENILEMYCLTIHDLDSESYTARLKDLQNVNDLMQLGSAIGTLGHLHSDSDKPHSVEKYRKYYHASKLCKELAHTIYWNLAQPKYRPIEEPRRLALIYEAHEKRLVIHDK